MCRLLASSFFVFSPIFDNYEYTSMDWSVEGWFFHFFGHLSLFYYTLKYYNILIKGLNVYNLLKHLKI